eukprot:356934-Chlamydomonas_euryale.AAC.7
MTQTSASVWAKNSGLAARWVRNKGSGASRDGRSYRRMSCNSQPYRASHATYRRTGRDVMASGAAASRGPSPLSYQSSPVASRKASATADARRRAGTWSPPPLSPPPLPPPSPR